MHQAGLDGRVRERRFDRLREAGEPVDADDRMSVTPRVFRSVRTCSQNFAPSVCWNHRPSRAFAVEVDAQRDVARLVLDRMPVADLHDQRIEVDDRVDALKRPVLHALASARTVSVTFEIRSGETSVP